MLAASVVVVVLASFVWIFSRSKPESEARPSGRAPIPADVARDNPAVTSPAVDSDNDGIPDFAELRTFEDRENFRRWFTSIAETQFYQLSDQWKREQRDCAGLVRFAMREALRHHDRAWFQRMGPAYEPVALDVAGFDLDNIQLG